MRVEIALVAGGLFRNEGFEAVSMRRIAREVGLSELQEACHMLVTVSEFPWPALQTLCGRFVRMCD